MNRINQSLRVTCSQLSRSDTRKRETEDPQSKCVSVDEALLYYVLPDT